MQSIEKFAQKMAEDFFKLIDRKKKHISLL